MQVSVERIDDLNRKVVVQVPEATIRQQVESRLKSLARDAKFDGFRPGKVPSTLIHKRYGKKVREEVLSDLIESTFARAVRDEKLKPAGSPQITAKGGVDGQDLEYEAAFEVFPEFVLMPVETLDVTRFVSAVTDQDVDDMLQRLREQRGRWQTVDRPAESTDRLVVTMEGTVDGEKFGEGKRENFPILLASKQLLPGFAERLVGAIAGSHHSIDLELPSDYHNPQWAGKRGHFEIEVTAVEESVIPPLDAEFVKSFGIEDGSEEALRADVRQNMEREMQRALQSKTKSGVMEVLFQANTLQLPTALVAAEIRSLAAPQVEAAQKSGQPVEETALRDRYESVARRRVALALILSKLIELNQLKVEPRKVREAVEHIAQTYEQPEQVLHWYYSNEEHLREVENMVLEDQVIDWILQRARVSDESVDFKDLIQSPSAAA